MAGKATGARAQLPFLLFKEEDTENPSVDLIPPRPQRSIFSSRPRLQTLS